MLTSEQSVAAGVVAIRRVFWRHLAGAVGVLVVGGGAYWITTTSQSTSFLWMMLCGLLTLTAPPLGLALLMAAGMLLPVGNEKAAMGDVVFVGPHRWWTFNRRPTVDLKQGFWLPIRPIVKGYRRFARFLACDSILCWVGYADGRRRKVAWREDAIAETLVSLRRASPAMVVGGGAVYFDQFRRDPAGMAGRFHPPIETPLRVANAIVKGHREELAAFTRFTKWHWAMILVPLLAGGLSLVVKDSAIVAVFSGAIALYFLVNGYIKRALHAAQPDLALDPSLKSALRTPEKIVWLYAPDVFDGISFGSGQVSSVVIGMASGLRHELIVGPDGYEPLLRSLAAVAPRAAVGWSEEREELYLRNPKRPPALEARGRQVAGVACAHCQDRIAIESEGCHCNTCAEALHKTCAPRHARDAHADTQAYR